MTPLPPPAPWPPVDSDVADALAAAMADGSWGRYEGRHCDALRHHLQDRWEQAHAMLCCSGTIAVELALRGLKVDGGEVILAGYDFPGNFRAIESVGARPVLVDLAADRYTLDASQLEQARSPQTRAVIVSHLHGHLAPMKAICRWASEALVAVVEDVCQSPGALVDGRQAGCWGDASTISFGGSKLLTAGRGGAVLTNDPAIAQRITVTCERGNHAYPLSELQAAVLLPQLDQLDKRNKVRAAGIEYLNQQLRIQGAPLIDMPAHHGAAFRVAWRSADRESVLHQLLAAGLPVGEGFRGFTRRRTRCRQAVELPHSKRAASETILLHHAALATSNEYLDAVANTMADCCR